MFVVPGAVVQDDRYRLKHQRHYDEFVHWIGKLREKEREGEMKGKKKGEHKCDAKRKNESNVRHTSAGVHTGAKSTQSSTHKTVSELQAMLKPRYMLGRGIFGEIQIQCRDKTAIKSRNTFHSTRLATFSPTSSRLSCSPLGLSVSSCQLQ